VMLAAAGSKYQRDVLSSGAGDLTGALPADSDDAAFEEARALDLELTLVAVTGRGDALEYASQEMRAVREVVLTAVLDNAFALRSASPALKGDHEVVLAAMHQNVHLDCLAFALAPALADPAVALTAVEIDADAMKYFESAVWRDRAVVLEAVLQQEILTVRYHYHRSGRDASSRPRRALDTYPLTSCGWEADAFLQEITAYPKHSLAAFDGLVGAHRRLAFASLALPQPPVVAVAELEPAPAPEQKAAEAKKFADIEAHGKVAELFYEYDADMSGFLDGAFAFCVLLRSAVVRAGVHGLRFRALQRGR